MAYSINQIIICGKVGRDAETKFTNSGVAVSTFSVATTHGVKKGDQWDNVTTWHNVKLWKNEKTAAEIVKGATVTVRGRMEHRQYEDKDGNKRTASEIVAEDVIVAGGSRNEGTHAPPKAAPVQGSWDGPTDDDIPF